MTEKDIKTIHNYLRDNNIPDENKPFFIACILIVLQNETFLQKIELLNTMHYADNYYLLVRDYLIKYNIDITVFEFLRNEQGNKIFYEVICMVNKILQNNPSEDLLNRFYSEFVRYQNTDSKSLGIVLTPEHIVKIMIDLLEIDANDIFLDLCAGTGSFAIEASKHTKNIIACELQNKLFNLLKCNFIIRNLASDNLLQGDCFQYEFKASKTAINPPYGMKTKNEIDFIIKQLDSIEENGLATAIIPVSRLTDAKPNTPYKQKLLEIASVESIILCNPQLFYPTANIHTCILKLKKTVSQDNTTKLINYKDDGVIIQKQTGKIKAPDFDEKLNNLFVNYTTIALTPENDWTQCDIILGDKININDIIIRREEEKLNKLKLELAQPRYFSFKETKKYTFAQLFDMKRGKLKIKDLKPGDYPFISSSRFNNGITNTCNSYSFENAITVANNGSVGYAFYQNGKFDCSCDITVLIPKIDLSPQYLKIISYMISEYRHKYNWGKKWSIARMKEDILYLPIKNGKINFDDIIEELQ